MYHNYSFVCVQSVICTILHKFRLGHVLLQYSQLCQHISRVYVHMHCIYIRTIHTLLTPLTPPHSPPSAHPSRRRPHSLCRHRLQPLPLLLHLRGQASRDGSLRYLPREPATADPGQRQLRRRHQHGCREIGHGETAELRQLSGTSAAPGRHR